MSEESPEGNSGEIEFWAEFIRSQVPLRPALLSNPNQDNHQVSPPLVPSELYYGMPLLPEHPEAYGGQASDTRQEFMVPEPQPSTSRQNMPPRSSPPPQHLQQASTGRNNLEYSSPRDARNRAEKQRRDRMTQCITQLATLVPPVLAAPRKVDRTNVLRLTAHYLRAHKHVFGNAFSIPVENINRTIRPSTAVAIMNIVNGFLLTLTYKGVVVVASYNVHKFLGYAELELIGHSFYDITHTADHAILRQQLHPTTAGLIGPNGELIVPEYPGGREHVAWLLANERRDFVIRLKRVTTKSEPVQYVTCRIEGSLRISDAVCQNTGERCLTARRTRSRPGDHRCSSGNDIVFIGMAHVEVDTFIKGQQLEAFQLEYITRHSVDGAIIQCDHRISIVAGYLTTEVDGINAMNFMNRDDVRWVVVHLRKMYDQCDTVGETCYRLITKTGQFIYLLTRGRLEIDNTMRYAKTLVCTNTLVNDDEGKHLMELMKQKYATDFEKNPGTMEMPEPIEEDLPVVENPVQLEKVILHLVENLPTETKPISLSGSGSSGITIIAPDTENIKRAIAKSSDVIGHTFIYHGTEPTYKNTKTNATTEYKNSEISVIQEIPPCDENPKFLMDIAGPSNSDVADEKECLRDTQLQNRSVQCSPFSDDKTENPNQKQNPASPQCVTASDGEKYTKLCSYHDILMNLQNFAPTSNEMLTQEYTMTNIETHDDLWKLTINSTKSEESDDGNYVTSEDFTRVADNNIEPLEKEIVNVDTREAMDAMTTETFEVIPVGDELIDLTEDLDEIESGFITLTDVLQQEAFQEFMDTMPQSTTDLCGPTLMSDENLDIHMSGIENDEGGRTEYFRSLTPPVKIPKEKQEDPDFFNMFPELLDDYNKDVNAFSPR